MIGVTQTFLPPFEEYTSQLRRIWDSRWLTNRGVLVMELEDKLTKYLGIGNILAVNNGTVALQIAIKALGLKGEIITTPFSYVATVSSIVWENCLPVFVDVDPVHLTIDEMKIEEAITEKTSAILATHVYGNPCNVEAIKEIADKHDLKVIYDAAHCFAVKYKGESILNWGDVSTLSFHATKLFHTGEGGAIVCNDKELAHKILYHHNFGHDGPEHFFGLGINGKMSELSAAMGLSVLPFVDEIIGWRRSVSDHYDHLLGSLNLIRVPIRESTEWNYSYHAILLPTEEALKKVVSGLNSIEVFPRRYFYPSLNKLPYLENSASPVADDVSARILCLPISAETKHKDVEKICEAVGRAITC